MRKNIKAQRHKRYEQPIASPLHILICRRAIEMRFILTILYLFFYGHALVFCKKHKSKKQENPIYLIGTAETPSLSLPGLTPIGQQRADVCLPQVSHHKRNISIADLHLFCTGFRSVVCIQYRIYSGLPASKRHWRMHYCAGDGAAARNGVRTHSRHKLVRRDVSSRTLLVKKRLRNIQQHQWRGRLGR